MKELFLTLLPYKVLFSHFLLAFLVLAIVFRKSWGRSIFQFVGKYALHIGLLLSVGAVVGSLFYSEIIGYEACVLCLWQRAFIYPLVPIFIVGLWKRRWNVWRLVMVLTVIAALIAAYQSFANLGGGSVLPCTAEGGACSRVYVLAFGYITIPLMSLTISIYVLLLAWINKIFKNESRTK